MQSATLFLMAHPLLYTFFTVDCFIYVRAYRRNSEPGLDNSPD